ncbi:hypothetical protein LEP48_03750 [Isoptericola sp. NEAU-Y5]|uniref:DUF4190 domain-containing protein n=1 Tax=Isoptericola luteus TaxID=2879484 RepID=A0ABS7ZDD3_9MICO|nr:hypothetical protein [Isoptericola sp. NEAU-Y5]MCA5892467.1 hypothetical protein [Isoptericola sp. NEAU-Y5]
MTQQHPPVTMPAFSPSGHAETKRLAVTSLILGLLWLGGIGSVLALVLGYRVLGRLGQVEPSSQREVRSIAVQAIVLGWGGVAFDVAGILLAIGMAVYGAVGLVQLSTPSW